MIEDVVVVEVGVPVSHQASLEIGAVAVVVVVG